MAEKQYIFREIKDNADLLKALRLRHCVYNKKAHLQGLISENTGGEIDIDGYDAYAWHYGLFLAGELIGYMRVVGQVYLPSAVSMLREIHAVHNVIPPIRKYKFCYQRRYPATADYLAKNYADRQYGILEISRFIIAAQNSTAELLKFVMRNIIAILCSNHKHPLGIMQCQKRHISFYERYGFNYTGVHTSGHNDTSKYWYVMVLSGDKVRNKLPRLDECISEYRANSCFSLTETPISK